LLHISAHESARIRPSKLSLTAWLVLTIASIGFLFDTYELLMTPLVAVPAIAELLQLPRTTRSSSGGLATCFG